VDLERKYDATPDELWERWSDLLVQLTQPRQVLEVRGFGEGHHRFAHHGVWIFAAPGDPAHVGVETFC
jgi:hypothetical protein